MHVNDAASKTEEFIQPIFGFLLKKMKSRQDAEDLTQEICEKIFKTLLVKEDIEAVDQYIWTIAHNYLNNYYRKQSKTYANCGALTETLVDDAMTPEEAIMQVEARQRLQIEIAHLSKMQRDIVIQYYYHEMKQADIARGLHISLGTVKWHLHDAKAKLKEGMETMRHDTLHFNPIEFINISLSGQIGAYDADYYFRDKLHQNIAYAAFQTPKTINELGDALGVSPVYVEDAVHFLEDNGMLIRRGQGYQANIIINTLSMKEIEVLDKLYEGAMTLIAGELYDALATSPLLEDERLYYPDGDKSFLLWALCFYVAEQSGKALEKKRISAEEAMVVRKDGGQNIITASIAEEAETVAYLKGLPMEMGPFINSNDHWMIWEYYNTYVDRSFDFMSYQKQAPNLLKHMADFLQGETLSEETLAFLIQEGLIKRDQEKNELIANVVYFKEASIGHELLALGTAVKAKHWDHLSHLKADYVARALEATPPHLKKQVAYMLQKMYNLGGDYLAHLRKTLVTQGKLKVPTQEQQKGLLRILIKN